MGTNLSYVLSLNYQLLQLQETSAPSRPLLSIRQVSKIRILNLAIN